MDIEQRLRQDADALDEKVAAVDIAGFLDETFAKLDDLERDPHPTSAASAEGPADRQVSWAPAPQPIGGDHGVDQDRLQKQLAHYVHSARTKGDWWSFRQVAELCEVLGRTDHAQAWWQCAAAAGDEDAQEHLTETMTN